LDSPCRDVVAVAKTTWKTEDLELVEQPRLFQQPVDVQRLRRRDGAVKGKRRFSVAIGARSTNDQNTWLSHVSGKSRLVVSRPARGALRDACSFSPCLKHYQSKGFCHASLSVASSARITSGARNSPPRSARSSSIA